MANRKNIFLGILLFSTILINLIKCQDSDMHKNSKVLACVSLARGAMKHEQVNKNKLNKK